MWNLIQDSKRPRQRCAELSKLPAGAWKLLQEHGQRLMIKALLHVGAEVLGGFQ